MMRRLLLNSVLLGLLVALGCDSGGQSGGGNSGGGGEAAVAEGGIKRVPRDKLPDLGDYGPELDDGKLTVAPPKDWRVLGRNKAYLAAFSNAPAGQSVPMITVSVVESPVSGFETVTEENVEDFAVKVEEMLAAKYGDKLEKNITEYPKAMILGDTPYVRYVKNFRKKDDPIAYQAQVLTTCKSGRMYNFELQVFQDKVKEHRDLGYAVAAGVQFKGGAKAAAPATTEEKPSDPAEESNPGENK